VDHPDPPRLDVGAAAAGEQDGHERGWGLSRTAPTTPSHPESPS